MAGVVVLCLTIALVLVGLGPSALASHVAPTPVDSNANCSGLVGIEELGRRVENPTDGSQTVVIDGVSYTIRWDVHGDNTFDWSTSGGLVIYAVFVKGGAGGGGNLYDYRPRGGAKADTGLHAPINPSGQYAGLSHISFCGDVENPTSTTEATTTSTTTTTTTTSTETPGSSEVTTTEPTTSTAGVSETTLSSATSTSQVSPTSKTPGTTLAIIAQNPTTSTSIEDEVLGISFLPFTGYWFEEYGTFALALLSAGLLLLVAARSVER